MSFALQLHFIKEMHHSFVLMMLGSFVVSRNFVIVFRGRTSNMSKSVSVLELSGKDKEKAAKPPRRLSIPSKSTVTPRQKSASNITPISETRSKRLAYAQERCETPQSDVSRSSTRRKFNILSSASYWLSQIKLSESANKHSISLAFFKLALEAGSEVVHLSFSYCGVLCRKCYCRHPGCWQ